MTDISTILGMLPAERTPAFTLGAQIEFRGSHPLIAERIYLQQAGRE